VSTDQESRFNVLLENVESQLKVVAEAQTASAAGIARLEARMDQIGVKVDSIDIKVDVLDRRVNALEGKVGALEGKVGALEGKVDALSVDTKQRLERIETHLGLNGSPKPKRKLAAKKQR
jgi:outer membrane murein-binding lipoprotein Lpp